MCGVLGVSTSGYYDWIGRGPSRTRQENEKILKIMRDSHTKAQGMIGLDKMPEDVKKNSSIRQK